MPKLVCAIVILMALLSLGYFKLVIDEAMVKYQAENDCIASYVALGIERKHIFRDNGSCYVEEW